ncbi:MAG: malto-oligosyltrehalose synthase, partial [Thermoleophilia bacterium]|nr:malto-oligosyltrehalose synthase [Thermoleophilia bacterium]
MPVPCSTYRLQMTAEFGFVEALATLPYLERLGVTDVYCSPLLRAAPGSTHGYDVADPTTLDPRLGTDAEFIAFSDELQSRGMGLVLDIVPNHMAASTANPWWRDVLGRGEESAYADHFDIDWAAGAGRLLLPVLGAPLAEVLAAGELHVDGDELAYHEHRYPLRAGSDKLATIAEVVDAQHYELADWREQARRLNYRRFFDITGLVGVRVELPHVFRDVHARILELVAEGRVTGLRVDHVDGLRDPRGYLEQLATAARAASGRDEPFYILVEKILAEDEVLPPDWPVAGTTGYHFLDACDGLFVDSDGAEQIAERYAAVTAHEQGFDDIVASAKLRTMREAFWGELGRLARHIVGDDAVDLGDDEGELRRVRDALAVVTAQLPIYRTYVDARGRSAEDQRVIAHALAGAAANPGVDPLALAQVGRALQEDLELTLRWQQFSGPVTAKSVEDTAFYRYYAVPARNEVGAHPSHPAAAVGSFHWLLGQLAQEWPHSMNASSTHDTKRSEDVRARLMVLTERPDWWADLVEEWLERFAAPDANDGWMVASTLVGAWPLDGARLAQYVRKALREEKERTSWTDPDESYESAVLAFGERLRTSGEVEQAVAKIAAEGECNSLAATALKLFAPGVPDTYQGTEVESLTLVDPDNRQPVDFAALDALLDSADAPSKLRLVSAALRARREHRELFRDGSYLPVRHTGVGVVAYARQLGDTWALVAVPRPGFQAGASAVLELPDGAPTTWRHVVTGADVDLAGRPAAELLSGFPVLMLIASNSVEGPSG